MVPLPPPGNPVDAEVIVESGLQLYMIKGIKRSDKKTASILSAVDLVIFKLIDVLQLVK